MTPCVLFGALLVAGRLAAQGAVPTLTLDNGARELSSPFSMIASMVELPDGRLLVVDAQEQELRLVDFTKDAVTPAARQGPGPLEYQLPGTALNGGSDTSMYYDATQRLLLLFSAGGVPVRTVPFGGMGGGILTQLSPPGAIDAAGRIYGQTLGVQMPGPGAGVGAPPTFSDSVEVQRFDPRAGTTTPVARIRNLVAQARPEIALGATGVKATITAPAFTPIDVWAVLPDGRVAILRDGVYQVRFVAANGVETSGPTIPFTAIPVTAVERQAVLDSTRAAMDAGLAATRAMAAQAGVTLNIDIEVLEPASWPASKPVYTGMRAAPDGRLWVSMSGPARASGHAYDVLNASGALIAHVRLVAGESIVGLGRGTVYAVRTDADDVQHLSRYTLPASLR